MLDDARDLASTPFKVNSGYRCSVHNKNIKGSPTSSHLKGLAADIATPNSHTRYLILKALLNVGFKRIGIYKTFIHVDIDTDKPQEIAFYI